MARGINKVTLVGNLGGDPELRYTGSGTSVCNLRLATSSSYKDSDGEWLEQTEWHQVVFFGRLAEVAAEYLTKGSQVYVEGSLRTRHWEDKDGNTRYTTEVVGRELVMLGGRGASSHDEEDEAPRRQKKAAPKTSSKAAPQNGNRRSRRQEPEDDEYDDGLPF